MSDRFFGREAEIQALGDALTDPAGKVILVGGQEGMGKTRLLDELPEILRNNALTGGVVRYETVQSDGIDSFFALMMDHAFEAAAMVEGSLAPTERRRGQWKALLNVAGIGDLVEALRRDPARSSREQLLERLDFVARRLPSGGRAVFVVDPAKYLPTNSAEAWTIIARGLPPKVNFVIAQRPDDLL